MTTTSSLRILLTLCAAAFVMNITNYIFYSSYWEKVRPSYYHKNQIGECGRQTRSPETLASGLLSRLMGAARTKPDAASCTSQSSIDYDTTTDRLATSSTPVMPVPVPQQ